MNRIVPFLLVLILVNRAGAWQMKQAPLMTQWAAEIDTNAPLPEYPRPQMVRSNWLNLNGIWQFQAGATNDAVPVAQNLSGQILVPYPMESAISGVMEYSEFSWYRRTFIVPTNWAGQKIILHLDAVNWQSQVYINGHSPGVHKGGYDPASYDITPYLTGSGPQELIVRVYSPEDNAGEPRGKQTLYPGGIMYASSSGIWQPVWLEAVEDSGVQSLKIAPDVDNSQLRLTVNTYTSSGVTVFATVSSAGAVVNTVTGAPGAELDIPVPNPQLWSPDHPFLYDLEVTVVHNGVTNDTVSSYFGMRKISISVAGGIPKMFLNNQFLFEMGPLDQGFWPDGIYTAPTDAALAYDIQMEKALGFNTVRKHIKVERQRWYYWADKLGIMVWQDMPSCNSYTGNPTPPAIDPLQFIAELSALVTNHWNSPSIILWDVFNESQGQTGSGAVGQTNTAYLVQLVKTLDPSRLVNQASGGSYFGVGDVLDSHSYPDPGDPISMTQAPVDGEFGGIAWQVNGHLWNPAQAGTGYLLASSIADISQLYDGYITEAINDKSAANGGLNAAIYTQITDVENECNGLMTYDRILKPDPSLIRTSNQKAITGEISLTTVVPTSQSVPQKWQYTMSTPATNWYASNFNASAWSTGLAGFGTADPNVTPKTAWTTTGYIYLRRTFNPGALSARDIRELVFDTYHDEDVAIYINGVPAGSAAGYSTEYVPVAMTTQGQAAIIPNGTNVLAVLCYQSTGGQFIDVGISKQTLVANTLTIPTDATGYWPLDSDISNVVVDASGNGDSGTVNNARVVGHGKVNGCLGFNGTNSYVQISNLISNDFSIAFWVKTAQAGGTGQWYEGTGLVDGEVSAGENDFGTAVSGGYFAFGVGNPEITILSTNAINDGVWHQCVATRIQSTGLISIYVDGAWQATGAGNVNSLTAAAKLRFGQNAAGAGYFEGLLDEVQIYNRALGNLEVSALYHNSAAAPAAPANVTATASNSQAGLSWSPATWASSYTVSRSELSGGPYTVLTNTTALSFTDGNLVNGTTYYYVVAARNLAGTGTNSSEANATPYSLAVWFKADAISGLGTGGTVTTWPDESGNGNSATAPNSSQAPVYVAGAINGLPVVRFNAADSTYLAFNRPVQDDFTILCVFRSTQGFGRGGNYYDGAGLVNGEVSGVTDDFGTSLNTNGVVLAGTGNPDTTVASAAGFNDGLPHIMTFKRTRRTGTFWLYLDGIPAGTATAGTQSLTAPRQLVLGAQQTLIHFLNGDMAEVKIFNTALSDASRMAEENELKCKYGLGAGGGPAMPTGVTVLAGEGKVFCDWQPVAGATSYEVWRSPNGGSNFEVVAAALPTSSYVETNTISDVTYYYQVAAANNCGSSAATAPVKVYLPNPSLGLMVSASANRLSLSWPSWASDRTVYYATNLSPPVVWVPVTSGLSTNSGVVNLQMTSGADTGFFQLIGP